ISAKTIQRLFEPAPEPEGHMQENKKKSIRALMIYAGMDPAMLESYLNEGPPSFKIDETALAGYWYIYRYADKKKIKRTVLSITAEAGTRLGATYRSLHNKTFSLGEVHI